MPCHHAPSGLPRLLPLFVEPLDGALDSAAHDVAVDVGLAQLIHAAHAGEGLLLQRWQHARLEEEDVCGMAQVQPTAGGGLRARGGESADEGNGPRGRKRQAGDAPHG